MAYLVKNKKIIFFLLLFFAFIPIKAHALIYKGYEYLTDWDTTSTKTCSGSSCYLDFHLTNTLTFNTDYIGIKMSNFAYTDNYNVNIGNYNIYCNNYTINSAYSNQNGDFEYYPTSLVCNNTSSSGSTNDSLSNNNIMITAKSYNDSMAGSPCWLDSELKDIFICPVQSNRFSFIRIFITGGSNDSYSITLDRVKLLLDNDSTDIISALSGVQTQQVNTINAIEQQTQQQAQQNAYVQSSNITQAQTNTTDSITVLNDNLTQELSQFSDLTQLVVAPITMFMELNNNVCAPLTLQIPFVNQTAVLPCIKPIMEQYFGGMYSVFTTVIGAILCYWTFVRTVALIKDLVDADNDKIEVVDL